MYTSTDDDGVDDDDDDDDDDALVVILAMKNVDGLIVGRLPNSRNLSQHD